MVQWLRLKAASPAPPAAHSASSSSKRARRLQIDRQQPAQQAQQDAQQPQHAGQQSQQAQLPQQAQHAQQRGSATSSIPDPAVLAGSLHSESAAPSMANSPAANLLATPLDIAPCLGAVSAQQEHAYMDTLAQLRSNMFEDVTVLIPDELPAAGTTLGTRRWLLKQDTGCWPLSADLWHGCCLSRLLGVHVSALQKVTWYAHYVAV